MQSVSKVVVRGFASKAPWREVSIPIPWGEIRGKWWGPLDRKPVLTLHGWQVSLCLPGRFSFHGKVFRTTVGLSTGCCRCCRRRSAAS